VARDSRATRQHAGVALAAVVGLLLAMAPASSALADPLSPADQAVQDAHNAVAAKVDEIARIELLLAQQSGVSDAAWQKVEAEGEAYTRATVAQENAAQAAIETTARFTAANTEMEQARKLLVGIAVQSSRNGGGMDMAEAVLVSGGVQEVVARTTALQRLGTKADDAAQRFQVAKLVADTLKKRADDALATSKAAAANAQATLAAAQQAQTDAVAAVAAVQVQREALIAQLAVARQTSVAAERARQDQIDAERAARAEAAAQAARLAQAAAAAAVKPAPKPAPKPASGGTSTVSTGSAGGGGTTTPPPSVGDQYGLGTGISRGSAAKGQAAVAWATQQLGLPYGWGGTGPDSYDCSGLTMRAWQSVGVNPGRTTRDQYVQVLKISYSDLRVGDLVFWGSDPGNPDSTTHVALWLGNGQILEAPRTGLPVRIASMRWAGTMNFAGRP
jgi:cell wall-associated NlpC family hydrolase